MHAARHHHALGSSGPKLSCGISIMRRLSPFAAPSGSIIAKQQPQDRGPSRGIAHLRYVRITAPKKAIATCAEPMMHLVPDEASLSAETSGLICSPHAPVALRSFAAGLDAGVFQPFRVDSIGGT
jgi:hypothetical protein